jgi:hypothetical protein
MEAQLEFYAHHHMLSPGRPFRSEGKCRAVRAAGCRCKEHLLPFCDLRRPREPLILKKLNQIIKSHACDIQGF